MNTKQLVEKYHNRLTNIVKKSTGNLFAEDAVQDTWIKLLNYEKENGNLDGLLNNNKGVFQFGKLLFITRNQAIDNERKEKKHKEKRVEADLTGFIGNGSLITNRVFADEAFRILDTLSDIDRELFLEYMDTLNMAQMAKERNVSRQYMFKKVKTIKEKIKRKALNELTD